jgi:hypothetical protein
MRGLDEPLNDVAVLVVGRDREELAAHRITVLPPAAAKAPFRERCAATTLFFFFSPVGHPGAVESPKCLAGPQVLKRHFQVVEDLRPSLDTVSNS